MNKSRSTPTPLNANSVNGLVLNCATPNSTTSSANTNNSNSANQLNLQCLNATNSSISSSNDTSINQQTTTNLSHSTNTNFSNNQLNSINSPYHDHSELNSPLLINGNFNNELTSNHLDRLNGSLNSLGSNSSSSSINSESNSLITFTSANNSKKITSLSAGSLTNNLTSSLTNGLANGLANSNFTANRENINCNSVQWIEFQMKTGVNSIADNHHHHNLDSMQTQSSLANSANSFNAQTWRLLESNLCNTNALLAANNASDAFDYGNHFISGNQLIN